MTIVAVAAVFLAGCGSGSVETVPTDLPATSATVMTATPGVETTVGDLIAGVEAAWPAVTSMQSTLTEEPVTGDVARDGDPTRTIEEVVAPASRRLLTVVAGNVTDEHVFAGGRVYMRGAFVAAAVAPEADPSIWVTVDPALVPPTSPLGQRVAYLIRPIEPPFGTVSATLRGQATSPAGTVTVEDRACTAYAFSDATASGEPIAYELAIDASGLPCQLTQRIVAPDAATPVSGTPEG